MKSQGLPGDESIELQRGDICAAIESVDGMYSLMLPLAVADQLGCEMEGYNASYMPSQMLGINRSGGQIGLAEEFVRFVLGDQVQDSDLMDGLPVNKKAAAHWASEDWGNPDFRSRSAAGTATAWRERSRPRATATYLRPGGGCGPAHSGGPGAARHHYGGNEGIF